MNLNDSYSKRHVRSAYGITVLKNSHRDIRRLRYNLHIPTIHGNKFWKSSFLLMDYLEDHTVRKGSAILEIGCGWGITGIFCAKKFQSRVTALDADYDVFPYLELHAKINNVSINQLQRRFENMTVSDLSSYEILLGSDICFWDEMIKPLFNFLRRAVRAKAKRVIIADPGRSSFQRLSDLCISKLRARTEEREISYPYNISGTLLIIDEITITA